MCNFLSAWVLRPIGEDKPRVLCDPMFDSHETIAMLFRIHQREDAGSLLNAARVEFTPPSKDGKKDYFNFDAYTLRVDEHERPGWFDDACEAHVVSELRGELRRMLLSDDSRLVLSGGAWLIGEKAKVETTAGCRILAVHDGANLARADLDGANLAGANLAGANFAGATLDGANLDGANLARANLDGANLASANLARANLDGANLARANLARANLAGANLDGANLDGANLDGAYLDGAYLDGAYLDGAYLARANLARANLDGAYRPNDAPPGWKATASGLLVRETTETKGD